VAPVIANVTVSSGFAAVRETSTGPPKLPPAGLATGAVSCTAQSVALGVDRMNASARSSAVGDASVKLYPRIKTAASGTSASVANEHHPLPSCRVHVWSALANVAQTTRGASSASLR
jgi:hypothetical protein